MKYFIFVAGLLALLLDACSSPAAATASAQARTSIAASAEAAFTMTPSAIPTETPAPLPTQTPLPSPTVMAQSTEDNCRHALDTGEAGQTHSTTIKNETTGTISVSLTLYKKNAYGQCGSIVVSNMSGNSSDTADLPAGSWSAYAWAKGKGSPRVGAGSFVVQPALSRKMQVCVRSGRIVYQSQC